MFWMSFQLISGRNTVTGRIVHGLFTESCVKSFSTAYKDLSSYIFLSIVVVKYTVFTSSQVLYLWCSATIVLVMSILLKFKILLQIVHYCQPWFASYFLFDQISPATSHYHLYQLLSPSGYTNFSLYFYFGLLLVYDASLLFLISC